MNKIIPWVVTGGVVLVLATATGLYLLIKQGNTTIQRAPIASSDLSQVAPTSSTISAKEVSSPISVEQAMAKIAESVADVRKVPIIATSTSRIWFDRIRESEGCGEYRYIDLTTGKISDFTLPDCPKIDVSDSYPFYVSDCLYASCYDHKTLYVVNMETLERRAVHTITKEDETSIEGCRDADFGPLCITRISFNNGKLNISIYDKMHPIYNTTKPGYQGRDMKALGIYENGNSIRVDQVDLYKEFGIQ